jgi:hypothetical protein
MFLTSLITLFIVTSAFAQQIVLDSIHNATSIAGTWSSGSKAVLTGAGFANPAKQTFNYPPTTGVSYSFTDTGFYEISRYRFIGNGSQPTCITGVILWVHGTYTFNPNGSLTMTPFGDGFQQVQDPCAAVSNFIQTYNDTELFQSWRIFVDPVDGYKLHLFQFDGSPVAPQFQVSTTPNMLPTQLLRNVTPPTPPGGGGLTAQNHLVVNAAERGWIASVAVASVAVGLGVLSIII